MCACVFASGEVGGTGAEWAWGALIGMSERLGSGREGGREREEVVRSAAAERVSRCYCTSPRATSSAAG